MNRVDTGDAAILVPKFNLGTRINQNNKEHSAAWKGCATKSKRFISQENSMKENEKTENAGGAGFPACVGKDELYISRRRLPHWQLPGSTYFITFRLKSGIISDDERKIVLDAIKHFHQVRYWLTTAVVMPDHVHLMLKPFVFESDTEFSLSKILQGIKGFSAREINKTRGAKGALWQDESFDRIVRDYDEFLEKWNYIRMNAVKTGLCQAPEDYPYLWEPGEPIEE